MQALKGPSQACGRLQPHHCHFSSPVRPSLPLQAPRTPASTAAGGLRSSCFCYGGSSTRQRSSLQHCSATPQASCSHHHCASEDPSCSSSSRLCSSSMLGVGGQHPGVRLGGSRSSTSSRRNSSRLHAASTSLTMPAALSPTAAEEKVWVPFKVGQGNDTGS